MFLVTDLITNLRAFFVDKSQVTEKFSNVEKYRIDLIEVQECSIMRHKENYEYWSVFHVSSSSGNNLFIRAYCFSDAIVEYCLKHGLNGELIIREYDDEFKEDNEGTLGNLFKVGSLSKKLLENLTDKNKDWCSYAIEVMNRIDSEEELIEYEKLSHTYSETDEKILNSIYEEYGNYHKGFDTLTAEQIKNRCSYVWRSYLFLESMDIDFDGMCFIGRIQKNKNLTVNETLFWTFFFEGWGGYDCQYPYQFYKKFLSDDFEELYSKREEIKKYLDT